MKSLREEVESLALPAGRVVGTPGHEQARKHLEQRLIDLGLEPYRGHTFALPYHTTGFDFCNLIGVAPGEDRALAPLLIGAHYDSVISAPCADDNAAAVALALWAGDHFRRRPAKRDVVIALFDAEEPQFFRSPAMGSIRFYEDQRRPIGVHAALIMDLVGHDVPLPAPEFQHVAPQFSQLLFVTGAESNPELPDVVRRCRVRDLPVIATLNRRVGDMSDHGIFRVNGDPYLFLSCGRWMHYHQPSDTPDRLNYNKMARIGEYLVGVARVLSETTLMLVGGRPDRVGDTTAFEITLLRDALGDPGMRFLQGALGLSSLESSTDLDVLAMRLQSYFEL